MRVLLDEDVPEQVIAVLRHLLRGRSVTHVHELGWSGKKDLALYRDASDRFEAIVTNNHRQLDDPAETAQIKKSGLHHICYGQRVHGLRGLALAIGAIIAAMPGIVDETRGRGRAASGVDPRLGPEQALRHHGSAAEPAEILATLTARGVTCLCCAAWPPPRPARRTSSPVSDCSARGWPSTRAARA